MTPYISNTLILKSEYTDISIYLKIPPVFTAAKIADISLLIFLCLKEILPNL